jgi:TPP-dependent pyruvate/acetoin dehydrogenase alpha subunit
MPCHFSFRAANFVSISSPIGTHVPHAVGMAMAARYRGDKAIAAVYLGDGGTSEGDFHVALNFAGVYRAPLVCIVENNQWAISCPSSEQTASEDYACKASAYGLDGVKVDGNDVLAVYDETAKAVEQVRGGGRPVLIENVTYRLFSHSSSDDADRYRPKGEYEAALKREPLLRYRSYLKREGVWTQAWEDELSEAFRDQVNAAIQKAEATPRPEVATLFEHVMRADNPLLREQAAQLEEELKERQSWEAEGAFPL